MRKGKIRGKWALVPRRRRGGFTLVEIMIVVGIIGMLAAIALPSLATARRNAAVARCASDLRVFDHALQQYAMERGSYPPDAALQPGVLTGGLDDYIKPGLFDVDRTPCGGRYLWMDRGGVFAYAYILCVMDVGFMGGPKTDLAALQKLDERIDDGNPVTGRVRKYGGVHYQYVVEFK